MIAFREVWSAGACSRFSFWREAPGDPIDLRPEEKRRQAAALQMRLQGARGITKASFEKAPKKFESHWEQKSLRLEGLSYKSRICSSLSLR
jgi:hypothetical protein